MAQLKSDEWPGDGEPTTDEKQTPSAAGKPAIRGGTPERATPEPATPEGATPEPATPEGATPDRATADEDEVPRIANVTPDEATD